VLIVKKMTFMLVSAVLLIVAWTSFPEVAQADIEWKVLRTLDLKTTPLDVAPSADGQRIFVLTPGEILVYSIPEGKITDRISVDKEFDRIVLLPRPDTISISSTKKKTVQIVTLENIYKIDVSGLPFKGPREAPVAIVIFDDYQ
jgi:hypothetical protein